LFRFDKRAKEQMRRVVAYQAPEVEWLAYELPVIAEEALA
jgi:hypothetical protein